LNGPDYRQALTEIYAAAVQAADGQRCTRTALEARPLQGPVWLAAIGKAAGAMAAGAIDALGRQVISSLVVTKDRTSVPQPVAGLARVMEASHPLPDARSITAGRSLVEFIDGVPAQGQMLFLISGGASALVEQLEGNIDVGALQQANAWLLGSGLPIAKVNRVRKALSSIKGGRLAGRVWPRRVRCLMLSDVAGDNPRHIGSGPLVMHEADDLRVDDMQLPDWLEAMVARAPGLTAADHFANVELEIVANSGTARSAARQAAEQRGLRVRCKDTLLTGDAREEGAAVARAVQAGAPGLTVYSSETTVVLPERYGQGGRCQQLALSAAQVLSGLAGTWLLAAGTDGDDGTGGAAGALVDSGTLRRGQEAGLDAWDCLERADAGRFLYTSGDLLVTGPTGTNVLDLVLGLKA